MTYSHALNLTAVCWCGRAADVFEDGRILCARHALEMEQANAEKEASNE
jgi:hypothetical protein